MLPRTVNRLQPIGPRQGRWLWNGWSGAAVSRPRAASCVRGLGLACHTSSLLSEQLERFFHTDLATLYHLQDLGL
jgi:hypothetical protein